MDIKHLKLILNDKLPEYDTGLEYAVSTIGRGFSDGIYTPEKLLNPVISNLPNRNYPKGGMPNPATAEKNANGTINKLSSVAQIGMSGIAFAGALGNSSKTSITADDMISNGSNASVGDISYDTKSFDYSAAMAQAAQERRAGTMGAMGAGASFGGSVGSLFGPVGGAIGSAAGAVVGLVGGLFGSSSAKRKAERQRLIAMVNANAYNLFGHDRAYTDYLRQQLAKNNGNDSSQLLYAADEGMHKGYVPPKTNMFTDVYSPFGKIYGEHNAYGNKNEVMVENIDGMPDWAKPMYKIPTGKNDTAKIHVTENTDIFSNNPKMLNPENGKTFAKSVPEYADRGELGHLRDLQSVTRDLLNLKNDMKIGTFTAKYGKEKLPKFWKGWESLASNGLGFLTSINDYISAKGQEIRDPNVVPTHPYLNEVRSIMGNRQANPYPTINQLLASEANANYAIDRSPGLSSGQKTLARMSTQMNSNLARANAMANLQQMLNQYDKENADMLNQMGTSLMDANMRSKMWNEDMLAKAHAAKVDQMNKSKYNILNYWQQFHKDNWERDQFEKMYGLYAQQAANERMKLENDTTRAGRTYWYSPKSTFTTPQYSNSQLEDKFTSDLRQETAAGNAVLPWVIKRNPLAGAISSPEFMSFDQLQNALKNSRNRRSNRRRGR